ncbi:lactonase family protein [Pseudarthrobacter sp. NIBRBAC000502770]|uniref:lactonase family protein n=1 Tax=Pseudarthrobacter sp. NIBRBAC000502770 TaxID=2590785 RepID=UPI001140205B|nr:lactonase family protein [Pseudarthrobacter sp. NIBRBAC000502770]QDG88178.1 lactonase family protein [Pseudarthrobacter sp. NIBRBAC000502770]
MSTYTPPRQTPGARSGPAPASRTGDGVSLSTGTFAYVGCRTTVERRAEGTGLSVFRIDGTTSMWEQVQHLTGLVNPSFLAWGQNGRHLYVVHGDHREVSAFAVESGTGRLEALGTVSCGGTNPVHLTVLDGRTLAVANYASGSIALISIGDDGSLAPAPRQVLELAPYTAGKPSQPHQILPGPHSKTLVVPDKGADAVHLIDYEDGRLRLADTVPAEPGAGPRHAVFHASIRRLYVVNELASTVTTYAYTQALDADHAHATAVRSLIPMQTLPTVPAGSGVTTAAGIVATTDGSSVYISNRGHNSVAHYRVDPDSGLLTPAGWYPTEGDCPRFLTLDPAGSRLYVANELSSTIISFAVDPRTGELQREPFTLQTGSPVCTVFTPSPLG